MLSGPTCSPSLHRRQAASTGVATEHSSHGWEMEGPEECTNELILKRAFMGVFVAVLRIPLIIEKRYKSV